MSVVETVLGFGCAGETLLGILSLPAAAPAAIGVLIVVGGPQYRAGSHRQFVLLARHLAEAGHAVLRFDVRGMGDSSGTLRDFEAIGDDIGAAIGALQAAQPAVRQVVLWGLCDAAAAALLYLDSRPDPRVAGLALANPWVRSQASLARTHVKHYYRQRLLSADFWRKLLRGGVALSALSGLFGNLRAAASRPPGIDAGPLPYQQRMARAWAAFGGPRLLLMSGDDYTAREFGEFTAADPAWQRALHRHPPSRVDIAGADHTCSAPAAQRAVEAATARWLAALPAAGA